MEFLYIFDGCFRLAGVKRPERRSRLPAFDITVQAGAAADGRHGRLRPSKAAAGTVDGGRNVTAGNTGIKTTKMYSNFVFFYQAIYGTYRGTKQHARKKGTVYKPTHQRVSRIERGKIRSNVIL